MEFKENRKEKKKKNLGKICNDYYNAQLSRQASRNHM